MKHPQTGDNSPDEIKYTLRKILCRYCGEIHRKGEKEMCENLE